MALTPSNDVASRAGDKFRRLVELMARLRAPGGCPWDRSQTPESLKPYLLEETYEVIDAIDRQDSSALIEELGDFVLQAVFLAEIAREEGRFDMTDVLDCISQKLVRRHPHVFADGEAKTPEEVKKRWDEIKQEEKLARAKQPGSLLSGVPAQQPALMEAQALTSKASQVGFDWNTPEGVLDKLHEELDELAEARKRGHPEELEEELGDLLFVLANLCRFLRVDAEQALRRANRKFRDRFGYMETELERRGKRLEDSNLEEMEALWQAAKHRD